MAPSGDHRAPRRRLDFHGAQTSMHARTPAHRHSLRITTHAPAHKHTSEQESRARARSKFVPSPAGALYLKNRHLINQVSGRHRLLKEPWQLQIFRRPRSSYTSDRYLLVLGSGPSVRQARKERRKTGRVQRLQNRFDDILQEGEGMG
jgi:hypothetical protein